MVAKQSGINPHGIGRTWSDDPKYENDPFNTSLGDLSSDRPTDALMDMSGFKIYHFGHRPSRE